MNGNGIESSSVIQRIVTLLEDHIKLGALECRYESNQARRRIGAIILGAVFGLTAFVFLQIVAVHGLLHLGLPLWVVCLFGTAFYGLLSVFIYRRWGRRNPRAGLPFQASGEELKRSLQWIRQTFIIARREIQERMEAWRGHIPQRSSHSLWGLWPVLKWLWPMFLAVGFEKTLFGLAGCLGLRWLVPKSSSRH